MCALCGSCIVLYTTADSQCGTPREISVLTRSLMSWYSYALLQPMYLPALFPSSAFFLVPTVHCEVSSWTTKAIATQLSTITCSFLLPSKVHAIYLCMYLLLTNMAACTFLPWPHCSDTWPMTLSREVLHTRGQYLHVPYGNPHTCTRQTERHKQKQHHTQGELLLH